MQIKLWWESGYNGQADQRYLRSRISVVLLHKLWCSHMQCQLALHWFHNVILSLPEGRSPLLCTVLITHSKKGTDAGPWWLNSFRFTTSIRHCNIKVDVALHWSIANYIQFSLYVTTMSISFYQPLYTGCVSNCLLIVTLHETGQIPY